MKNITCLLGAVAIALAACQKELVQDRTANDLSIRLPMTNDEQYTVDLIKETAGILAEVYKTKAVSEEADACIYSGYYSDERVLLSDLLQPETSDLYKDTRFLQAGIPGGSFKKYFLKELQTGRFPLLANILLPGSPVASDRDSFSDKRNANRSLYWQTNINNSLRNISIYFPYSMRFSGGENNFKNRALTTIVAADREADEGPGLVPHHCLSGICYSKGHVNDQYCENNPTHIVGTGAEKAAMVPPPHSGPVTLVYLGSVRCNRQYDRLISFTGNGGGSELRFVRADGFLQQNANGQITSPENTISVNCSRSDIRKKRWLKVNSIWDANWELDNKEQVFGIYEEDNEGSKTFSGSVQTKLKSLTIEPIAYSFTVKTKDDIIRQLNWNRQSFFNYNDGKLDNGCGSSNGWSVYDCNLPVSYTLPQQQ